jgi:hypothetical protein
MPIVRVNVSLAFWQRILNANPDIPLDPETQEPIMTEVQMARKQVFGAVKKYVAKDESRKRRQAAKVEAEPITEDDFKFED